MIADHLAQELANLPQGDLADAMGYACTGGKALRGFLTLESARLFGIDPMRALYPAMAIECLHAYSLIHDDLPAMDDDNLRRGKPTVHVKWNDATAILAGDALQSLAFDLVTRPEIGPSKARLALTRSLAQAAGARGMVLGQMQDIAAETAKTPLDLAAITALQGHKTGQLIAWAAAAGARMAHHDPTPLLHYGKAIGLAFQISDDILDVEGEVKTTGKALRKDADAGKATFVSLLGLDGAKTRAHDLVAQAQAALADFGPNADVLTELAHYIVTRDR